MGMLGHFKALASMCLWRHMRLRSLGLRLVRAVLPAVLVLIVHFAQSGLLRLLHDKSIWQRLGRPHYGEALRQYGTEGIITTAVDAIFCFVVLAMTSMMLLFFVQQITREVESGQRQLLHIVGLSRYSYWASLAGVEGATQMFLELLTMAAVARFWTKVRLLTTTSVVVLTIPLLLIVFSVVVLGSVFQFLFGRSRTSIVASMSLAVAVTVVPIVVSAITTFGTGGHLIWMGGTRYASLLACPVLPAYHTLFLLVGACADRGRCISLQRVLEAVDSEVFTTAPYRMIRMMIQGPGDDIATSVGGKPSLEVQYVELVGLVLAELVLWGILVLLLDARRFPTLYRRKETPKEVSALVEVQELTMAYGFLPLSMTKSRALDGVSFFMRPGSTLGLLGPNGAGKTTSIKCITGEETPQRGNILIRPVATAYGGEDSIGLCPQETVLFEDLTVEEHIYFFGRIRAVRKDKEKECFEQMIEATLLTEKRFAFPSQLSGGMRRRLAVGCALTGSSTLTFLDEPTTGLDPFARRQLWTTIGKAKADGSCLLLTTHMLEEAEALCSDIVILNKGRIATQGSVQELKDVWGTGYMLTVDANDGEEEKAMVFIASQLQDENKKPVKVSQLGQMTFKVGRDVETVGQLFLSLGRRAEGNGIKRWGISQATLEDAYVRIILQESLPAESLE